MAVEAAVVRGVGATARRLRLNATEAQGADASGGGHQRRGRSSRVSWSGRGWRARALPECVLEAEAPCGTKLRIHLKADGHAQAAALGRMLWRDEG